MSYQRHLVLASPTLAHLTVYATMPELGHMREINHQYVLWHMGWFRSSLATIILDYMRTVRDTFNLNTRWFLSMLIRSSTKQNSGVTL
jgi:hypothetical protein